MRVILQAEPTGKRIVKPIVFSRRGEDPRKIVKRLPEFAATLPGGRIQDPEALFWAHMEANFHVGPKTKIPVIEVIPFYLEGSSNGKISYDGQQNSTEIYLLPSRSSAGT